ncbi:MAG TPA: hypothetical protein VM580_33345 [Labilithrix sp.]|nr:hypothetical protein [Labilithrix sp.]
MTLTRPISALKHDNRGAVMLTGLFMSCFLIGALWFLIGVGDTLVFRDKMQEATDHAAYASAALHAKGMNFISLCNLVLLAGVTIHIILGIIHDISLALCIISIGFACFFFLRVRRAYKGYFNRLKPAAKAIHVAGVVASYSYPAMGVIQGVKIGASYGNDKGTGRVTVVPFSTSLVPGPRNKEGLPVMALGMNFLCRKIVNVGFTEIFNKALGVSPKSPGNKILDLTKRIIGALIEIRYCNSLGNDTAKQAKDRVSSHIGKANDRIDEENAKIDAQNAAAKPGDPIQERIQRAETGSGASRGGFDPGFDSFWGEEGPLAVFIEAANGNEWFQTYAINFFPKMTDMSDSRIGIAKGPRIGFKKYEKAVRPTAYIAQSEFYLDCTEGWWDLPCNWELNGAFKISWRARLRRVSIPNISRVLASLGMEYFFASKPYQDFKNQLDGFDPSTYGVVGSTVLKEYVDYFIIQAQGTLKGQVVDAVDEASPLPSGPPQRVFH